MIRWGGGGRGDILSEWPFILTSVGASKMLKTALNLKLIVSHSFEWYAIDDPCTNGIGDSATSALK